MKRKMILSTVLGTVIGVIGGGAVTGNMISKNILFGNRFECRSIKVLWPVFVEYFKNGYKAA